MAKCLKILLFLEGSPYIPKHPQTSQELTLGLTRSIDGSPIRSRPISEHRVTIKNQI